MYANAILEGESSKLGTFMLGFRKEGQNSKYVLPAGKESKIRSEGIN